jgi:predicted O-methyltransferase YrrM
LAPPAPNPIADERVNAVLERLHNRARRQVPGIIAHFVGQALMGVLGRRGASDAEAAFFRDKLISISRDQGWLIYQMCRSLRARRVVEFGTSYGVSTLYLAAAVRDNGGGTVIGTEIEPSKAQSARAHFAEAGLENLVELREGDALQTLVDCGGPVDFLLVDGSPKLARPVIELMASQLKQGAMVVCDNVGHFPRDFADYLDYVRRPTNGFTSSLLSLRSGTEISVKI